MKQKKTRETKTISWNKNNLVNRKKLFFSVVTVVHARNTLLEISKAPLKAHYTRIFRVDSCGKFEPVELVVLATSPVKKQCGSDTMLMLYDNSISSSEDQFF